MNQTQIRQRMVLLACWLVAGVRVASSHADESAVVVEPAELARRGDLVGREIVVDDRIRYFLETKRGQGFDELVLKRTEVPFRLLAGSRFARPPSEPNAVVRATLKLVDGRLIGEVITLDLQPNDIERLDREISRVRPDNFAVIRGWASWAERRGHELNDPKLAARGVTLETDTLWNESARAGADPIALADAAANRPIPREIREALYFRGFRRAAEQATNPTALADLARRVQEQFPRSVEPKPGLVSILKPGEDPGSLYRAASDEDRLRLNRQLYADLVEKSITAQLAADPTRAMGLVEEATKRLPDRPALTDELRQRGLAEAERGVASMRQSQVEALARTFREAGQPERARQALEDWLEDRRKHRLSPSDAEGRVLLAANYEKLLGDRTAAGNLLIEAERIDPQSRSVADAFLRLGFRKGDAGWYDPTSTTDPSRTNPDSVTATPPRAGADNDSLRGKTRSQARSQMGGKPDLIVRSVSQGMIVEQWIYRTGGNEQVLIFRIDPTSTEPRVAANYVFSHSKPRP